MTLKELVEKYPFYTFSEQGAHVLGSRGHAAPRGYPPTVFGTVEQVAADLVRAAQTSERLQRIVEAAALG